VCSAFVAVIAIVVAGIVVVLVVVVVVAAVYCNANFDFVMLYAGPENLQLLSSEKVYSKFN